jgi:hypothetical protein
VPFAECKKNGKTFADKERCWKHRTFALLREDEHSELNIQAVILKGINEK